MTRNIFIICFCLVIILWNLYLKKSELLSSKPLKIIARVLLAYCLMGIIIPNIPTMISPFEPVMPGKVLDSITNKPVSNCNIKIYWMVQSAGIASNHSEAYHQYWTKTDEDGNFLVPKKLKALTVMGPWFPLIICTSHGGTQSFAYAHGYMYGKSSPFDDRHYNDSYYKGTFYLKPLNNVTEYVENMHDLKNKVFSYGYYQPDDHKPRISKSEKEFLITEYKYLQNSLQSKILTKDIADKLASLPKLMQSIDENIVAGEIQNFISSMRNTTESIKQK